MNGEAVSLILVLGFALFVSFGNGVKWAAKMLVSYVAVSILSTLLKYVSIPVLSVMMSVFGVTILKFIPIVMVGNWILRTTHMDDLMVALQRMRLPQSVTIPLVVMFRYIPTLGIEYRMIRNTMDIRGISDTFWKRITRPVATVEYILIPLLMRCLKVTDELRERQEAWNWKKRDMPSEKFGFHCRNILYPSRDCSFWVHCCFLTIPPSGKLFCGGCEDDCI